MVEVREYAGLIRNHVELADELDIACAGLSRNERERAIVAAAWERWHEQMGSHINGQFAIVLVDEETGEVCNNIGKNAKYKRLYNAPWLITFWLEMYRLRGDGRYLVWIERAIRDYLTDDVTEVWVDDADMAERIRNTVALLFPNKKELVRLHNDTRRSMWERFNLRRQLDQIYSREVLMPSGGRLCFDQTEALMAIDINSGKISGKGNFEAMAFKTNMEAAETIARQLKLRDIGGQVVIDFIEMKEHKHVAEVERTLRNAMKYDRARHDVAHMSSFGLLELVRQRTGNSAISISMEPCPACGGTGLRRNLEWQSLQALRDIARALRSRSSSPCQYELPQELGLYLLNHKRDALKELEQRFHKNIEITIKP